MITNQIRTSFFSLFNRAFIGLLAATLVFLAGCSGGGGSSSPNRDGSSEPTAGTGGTGGTPEPSEPTPGPSGDQAMTIMVVAVDSLMPEDIDPTVMPNVQGLIDSGTTYSESRSVFSAETIPNHIAMMTGVNPDRNGIPTNNFWDRDAGGDKDGEDLDNPNELTAKTMFTWIDEECRSGATPLNPDISTGAVLSKTYLWEVFRGDAVDPQSNDINLTNLQPDSHWDPQTSPGYIGPGSEHTPDNFTGPEAVSRLPEVDFMFVNLGDVDRSSHAAGAGARQGSRNTADQQVGNIIAALQDAGRWDKTIMILVSDHGMDFSDPNSSPPNVNDPDALSSCATAGSDQSQCAPIVAGNLSTNTISTQPVLNDLATASCGFEEMTAVQNGGTNSIAVTSGVAANSTEAMESLLAARACLMNRDGSDASQPACDDMLDAYADTPIACKAAVRHAANDQNIIEGWYVNPVLYDNSQPNTLNAFMQGVDPTGVTPASIRSRHENLGDLVFVIADGLKFSEPDPTGNPIPGNHGHLVTIHNTTIVSGGFAAILNAGVTVNTGSDDHFERNAFQSENIDVATTVAWLLGLIEIDANGVHQDGGLITYADFPDNGMSFPNYDGTTIRNGFDGRVLVEAFANTVPPSNCGLLPAVP